MNRIWSALLALPLSAGIGTVGTRGVSSAQAPAETYLRGADGIGIVAFSGGDNLSVQEMLTFDLRGLAEENNYGRAEAVYTFYNQGEADTELTLLLPFGRDACYEAGEEQHTVSADGQSVECRARYTYAGDVAFSLEADLSRLCEDYRKDAFFTETMPVTEYVYRTDGTAKGCDGVDFEYVCNPMRTKLAFSKRGFTSVKNGRNKTWIPLGENAEEVRVYAIGEPLGEFRCSAYQDKKVAPTGVALRVVTVKETDFYEFALRNYPEESSVSRTDWYNGFVDMLVSCDDGCAINAIPADYGRARLMKWYEYALHIPAGESVTNVVTVPLRPNVSLRNGKRYEYEFQLSPAQRWQNYEGIEIKILTPYDLAVSSLDFEKTALGYEFARDCLLSGDLAFTIAESTDIEVTTYGNMTPALTTALVMLTVVVCLGGGIVVFLIVRSGRSRRAANDQGEVKEGIIDLGRSEDQDD